VGGGNKPGSTVAGGKGPGGAGGRPATATAKPFTPPKGATAKPNPRGGTTYTAKNGTEFHTAKGGNLTSLKTKSGATAHFGSNGKVASIHTKEGLTINHGARGGRVVESRLKGGGRVVSYGGHRGFVERPFNRGGRAYMRRSYYYGGRRYAAVYRGYYWGGYPYYGYVPAYYYGVGFYGWAYNPWAAPVAWGWGWGGAPWYGYYGYYFNPYPVYASPAFWITDFLLAENLRAAYEAQQAAANAQAAAEAAPPPPADSNAVVLTPEVKQAIADEVRAQIEAEKAAAAAPNATAPVAAEATAAPAAAAPSGKDQLPDALNPKNRTFVVSNTLAEQTDDGTACSLSAGDVLTRIGDTPDANQSVKVLVTSSQNNDCAIGTQVAVGVQDLQDMHNDFRQKMDAGLQSLADNQGKNGMPSSPAPGKKAVPEGTAKPDDDAEAQLNQTDQNADKTEADVQQSQQEGSGDD
jgi:hypothetical protein